MNMIRKQDRPALKRFIAAVFTIEKEHSKELNAIANDESLTGEQKADKYLDTIINRLEFAPDINEIKKL